VAGEEGRTLAGGEAAVVGGGDGEEAFAGRGGEKGKSFSYLYIRGGIGRQVRICSSKLNAVPFPQEEKERRSRHPSSLIAFAGERETLGDTFISRSVRRREGGVTSFLGHGRKRGCDPL